MATAAAIAAAIVEDPGPKAPAPFASTGGLVGAFPAVMEGPPAVGFTTFADVAVPGAAAAPEVIEECLAADSEVDEEAAVEAGTVTTSVVGIEAVSTSPSDRIVVVMIYVLV